MRSLIILGIALATLIAGTTAAGLVPPSAVTNGSFDTSLAGWPEVGECRVHPQWSATGATPIGGAAFIPEGRNGCSLHQDLAGILPDVTLVSWWAKVSPTAGTDSGQGMGLYPNAGARLLNVNLWTNKVQFMAFGTAYQTVQQPTLAGDWHHYAVVLVRPFNTGYLFLDGSHIATAVGGPAPQPDFLWLGDGANSNAFFVSPDVTWDEFYVGPAA